VLAEIDQARQKLANGDVGEAIRKLQFRGRTDDPADFEAIASMAGEIRQNTSKGREQRQCDALVEDARASVLRLERQSTVAMGSAAPVCPYCGTPARGVVHCPMCAADLTSTTLITRAEWKRRGQTEPTLPGSLPGTKVCPRCAEEVKLAAVVCRFCSHQFDKSIGLEPDIALQPAMTSGVAIAAFLCSLVGLWFAGIPLGIHAQRTIDRSAGRLAGRGFATAGIVLGVLGIVGTVVLIVIVVNAAKHSPGCAYTYQATGACVPGT
jgi:Domain of unknown function (DUF4190)/Uncharacterised protein family UPF0547